MRLNVLATSVTTLLLVSCHAPDYDFVRSEVYSTHQSRWTAATSRVITDQKLIEIRMDQGQIQMPRLESKCYPPPQNDVAIGVTFTPTGTKFEVGECALQELAMGHAAAILGKKEDGSTLALIMPQWFGGRANGLGDFLLARSATNEFFLLRPKPNMVERRRAYRSGSCDFMPSPGRQVQQGGPLVVAILDGVDVDHVHHLDVPIDTIDISLSCDEETY